MSLSPTHLSASVNPVNVMRRQINPHDSGDASRRGRAGHRGKHGYGTPLKLDISPVCMSTHAPASTFRGSTSTYSWMKIVRMPTARPTSSDSMRSTTNHPTGYWADNPSRALRQSSLRRKRASCAVIMAPAQPQTIAPRNAANVELLVPPPSCGYPARKRSLCHLRWQQDPRRASLPRPRAGCDIDALNPNLAGNKRTLWGDTWSDDFCTRPTHCPVRPHSPAGGRSPPGRRVSSRYSPIRGTRTRP